MLVLAKYTQNEHNGFILVGKISKTYAFLENSKDTPQYTQCRTDASKIDGFFLKIKIDNSIHIDIVRTLIDHTFNQPCASVIEDVSRSESLEGFDFFSGTQYDCETITEPVDDVIEVELDDDANGDGVAEAFAGTFAF